jgi:hypothetical protein
MPRRNGSESPEPPAGGRRRLAEPPSANFRRDLLACLATARSSPVSKLNLRSGATLRQLSGVISSTLDSGLIRRPDDSRHSSRDPGSANHLARRASGSISQAPRLSFCFRRAVDREPMGAWGIVEEAGRPPPTFTPRARPVTQGAAILDCALAFLGPRWFPGGYQGPKAAKAAAKTGCWIVVREELGFRPILRGRLSRARSGYRATKISTMRVGGESCSRRRRARR